MNTVFHIESENLLQIIQELNNAKIEYTRINNLSNTQTPYQNIYDGMDIEIEESNLPAFLRWMQRISREVKLYLYRKENWQTKINAIPYYRPYPIEEEENPLFKTTFFYQKLRRAEEFQSDFSDIEKEVYPSFLEHIEITRKEENHLVGLYESISHPFNSSKVVAEDLGKFDIQTIKEEGAYKILTKIENRRKQFRNQGTLNDYLFEIPSKNGMSTYQMLEYFILYQKDCVLHFGEETAKVELYKRKGNMEYILLHTFLRTKATNEEEKQIITSIETWSRRRCLEKK